MGRPLIDVEKEAHPGYRRAVFAAAMGLLIVGMIAIEHGLFTPDDAQRRSSRLTPATEDLAFNPFRLKVTEHEDLAAWYIPYREPVEGGEEVEPSLFLFSPQYAAPKKEPGGTVLILGDGIHSKRSSLPQARTLHRLGYHVYLFDYRGTGSSPGSASLGNFLEDSLTMTEHVLGRRPEDRLALYGLGVGANLALETACCLEQDSPGTLRALVLDTPEPSLETFHRQIHERRYGRWLASLLAWRHPLPNGIRDAPAQLEELPPLPMLWLHSQEGEIPPQATARLCSLSKGLKDFWLVPQSRPGEGAERFPLETGEQLARFLDPLLLRRPRGNERPDFIREFQEGENNQHFVRFTASPSRLAERPRLPVEVHLLTAKGLYSERRWVERSSPALTYQLEEPPLLAMAKVFRFVEPCTAEAAFTLSCCEYEEDYYQRLTALRTARPDEPISQSP